MSNIITSDFISSYSIKNKLHDFTDFIELTAGCSH